MTNSNHSAGSGAPTIGDILGMDDEIDDLSNDQVKDALIRTKYAHQLAEQAALADLEHYLKYGDAEELKYLLLEEAALNTSYQESLEATQGPEIPRTIFDHMTTDDQNVFDAREDLKEICRDSGFTYIDVCRERIRYLLETDYLSD